MLPRADRSGGFSLAEALVAIAIAAVLAAVLTRFVSTTRLNALNVREVVAMDILSNSLIEHSPAQNRQPGRTDGRTGNFWWRMEVAPVSFFARARFVKQKEKTPANPGQGGALGLTLTPDATQNEPQPVRAVTWVPYRVTAIVTAPSGRKYEVDTIRIGRAETGNLSGQANEP
jgi:type II secretory pathway pseudopilin PulG